MEIEQTNGKTFLMFGIREREWTSVLHGATYLGPS